MRLKPHEAQSYRKKALWVSWISIVVTLILAVAGFSKFMVMLSLSVAGSLQDVQLVLVRSSFNHPQTAHRLFTECLVHITHKTGKYYFLSLASFSLIGLLNYDYSYFTFSLQPFAVMPNS